MARKIKKTVICEQCRNPFKVSMNSTASTCINCILIGKKAVEDAKEKTKNPTKKTFEIKLDSREQKLAALIANADAFHQAGGAPLMLTEHVENGIDAIKQNRKSVSEGGSNFTSIGKVEIIIDEQNSQVIIIDNGTGILKPIWIIENPFKSLKTSADYTGQYGRGLHGFRGFCNQLEYISLRNKPSDRELDEGKHGENQRCVKIEFENTEDEGSYEVLGIEEFRKFSKSETGTVVILKNWLGTEFEDFISKRDSLEKRIQHHFGKEIENKQIEIKITRNKKSHIISQREFEMDNRPLIVFDIPDLIVKDKDSNKEFGKIKFTLFKASSRYKHDYKKPFLIVKGRPLQSSFFANMEEFNDNDIWSSHYLTGYIECDFIHPNQLRIAIEPGEEKSAFVHSLRLFANFELKEILSKYIQASLTLKREEENKEIIFDIQKQLKKMKIPLDFKGLNILGKLKKSEKLGDEEIQRISDIPGDNNEGLITPNGTDKAEIYYKKQERKPTDDSIIEIVLEDPKKRNNSQTKTQKLPDDGVSKKTVTVDSKLFSKGGIKRRKSLTGPGIGFQEEEINPIFSWYESTEGKVIVNSGTDTYKKLEKRSRNSKSEDGAYDKKLKNYISERYLWEVIMNCIKNKTFDEKQQFFWEAYHEYFIGKDTT